MNKNLIYVIVVIAIIAGIWFWMKQPSIAPVGVTGADDTASINKGLNAINVQGPDFNAIDTDLNSL